MLLFQRGLSGHIVTKKDKTETTVLFSHVGHTAWA